MKAKGLSLRHRIQLPAIIHYGLIRVPRFWGEYPKAIYFLSTYKKEEKNLIKYPREDGLSKFFFKA